jgi:hypothetical protein
LQAYCRSIAGLLQAYCRSITGLLKRYYRSITGLLQVPVKNKRVFLQAKYNCVTKFFRFGKTLLHPFCSIFLGVSGSGKIFPICYGGAFCVPNFVSLHGVLRRVAVAHGERRTGVVVTQTGRPCLATSGRPVARAKFARLCKTQNADFRKMRSSTWGEIGDRIGQGDEGGIVS